MTFPILPSNGAGTTGYNLTRSLRFRASASASLSRTPASATNRQKFTYSDWVKRGTLGTTSTLMSVFADTSNFCWIRFSTSDTLDIGCYAAGSLVLSVITTQVFRDPSACYHIIVAMDTTQATASNRLLVYVNGAQVTSFGTTTYPSLNANLYWNYNAINRIGAGDYPGSPNQFDGYQAELNYIDGLQLTPSSFGSINSTTGVWQPAKYTGSYGTNGFYLPFTDNSALTTSSNVGLGKDFSGNGNYWTTNNISITAGSTYDSMTDVPTLTSATAANYCVWNPLDIASTMAASNGNLKLYGSSAVSLGRASIALPSTGKFYYEMTMDLGADANNAVGYGVCLGSRSKTAGTGQSGDYMLYISNNGYLAQNGVAAGNIGFVPAVNAIIQVAIDIDNNKLWFGVNNLYYIAGGASTGNPSTGANPTLTGSFSGLFPFLYLDNTVTIGTTANFGQRPFAYTPPSGFVALNTYNLPDSTIKQGSTAMNAVLQLGSSVNTGANLFAQSGYTYGMVWGKDRAAANNNQVVDTSRGTSAVLQTNTTAAETTYAAPTSGDSCVAWAFNSSAAPVSNTNGTITSTTSVNASAGFSVVTYMGTNTATNTIGHGLNVAPAIWLIKNRTTSGGNWVYNFLYNNVVTYLFLNSTQAGAAQGSPWSTLPTSSVITLGGSDTNTCAAGNNYVMYAWTPIPGFSAFGSYVGNASTSGPFIYTGFTPKFLLVKRTDSTGDWYIVDSVRNTFNTVTNYLSPDLSAAEASTTFANFTSNGFQIVSANTSVNGTTMIYAAFASNPFKNSLAF